MSQVFVNFIENNGVSVAMDFRLRHLELGSAIHKDKFVAVTDFLGDSNFFVESRTFPGDATVDKVLIFAQEVDVQDVVFLVIKALAGEGWYFESEAMGLSVFTQPENVDDLFTSQVVVQSGDDNRTIDVRMVIKWVGVESQFKDAMSDYTAELEKYSSFELVDAESGFSYQYRSEIPVAFSRESLFRLVLTMAKHKWVYRGEVEDMHMFVQQS